MRQKIAAWMVGTAFILCAPPAAYAQLDHLSCFKVKDSQKFDALVTLDAGQDAFDAGQCTVLGKAKLFCVPTNKMIDEFTVDKAPGTPIPIGSDEQTADTVCYKVKCPKTTIADETVVDQFGIRTMSKFKVQLLCGPAHKQAAMCMAPDPPQCPFNDPCGSNGVCSTTRVPCTQQGDCPLSPSEECCCGGICI